METLGYILASVTFIWLWTNKMMVRLLMKMDKNGKKFNYRSKTHEWFDRMPFNCGTCLAFWTSLVLFYFYQDIYFLSLPLVHKLIHKFVV